jgi:hypothetical protein
LGRKSRQTEANNRKNKGFWAVYFNKLFDWRKDSPMLDKPRDVKIEDISRVGQ